MATSNSEIDNLLARMADSQHTPESYQSLLRDMPESAKRNFVEMSPASIREYSVRHVTTKLKNNPGMAKLLNAMDVKRITESVYNNIMEDQQKVRKILHPELDRLSSRAKGSRWRTIRG